MLIKEEMHSKWIVNCVFELRIWKNKKPCCSSSFLIIILVHIVKGNYVIK